MKLITHPLDDGSGASAAVCVCTYDERHVPAGAGFIWNRIVPKAWATTSATVAAKLWMHADETTVQRLLRAGVITMDQRDQRLRDLAQAAPASKRDRAEELAIRLATQPALIEAIHFMLRFMAGRCDGAVTEDGVGFNGTDTGFGHQLAASPSLSPKQAAYGQIMLWKYMGQLGHLPQFDLVYGAEAEAERERMKETEAAKLQQRMAGKVCKAHGRQITFLAKGKRVGFCDECKPVDTQQALADAGLPTIQTHAAIPDGVVMLVPNDPRATAADVVVARVSDPACPICQQPIIDTRSTCNHASAMNANQRETEKRLGRVVCLGCDLYIISGLHRCMGKPKVAQHPVDAIVGLMEAAGLGELIDPAKVDEARRFADAPVVTAGPDGVLTCPRCQQAALILRDGVCQFCRRAETPVDGAGSPPEASAPGQGAADAASGPVREVAGLTAPLDGGMDRLWNDFEARHGALKLLASARQRDDLITDAMLDHALTGALAVAAQVAKAEAKAGHIIKAARR